MTDPLAPWADFPADDVPRPLVLTAPAVRIDGGFVSGPAKTAYLDGTIASGVPLPDGVLELITGGRDAVSKSALQVTGVRRARAWFGTDRGPDLLPAFALDTTGTRQPITVLDPAVDVWWPIVPGRSVETNDAAEIDTDGRTLHVMAHGGVLTNFLRCEFTETSTAVLATPITEERITDATASPAVGIGGRVTGRLTAPLGGRVLIDRRGLPIPVVPGVTRVAGIERLVRLFYERLWNVWDDRAVDELLAPGFTFRGSLGTETSGRDEWRTYRDAVRGGAADFHNQIETLVVDGDRAAARLTYTGTHTGSLAGIAPTGRRFAYSGAAFFTAHAGRLTSAWVLGDLAGLRQQLTAD